jgi:hypothetical protein
MQTTTAKAPLQVTENRLKFETFKKKRNKTFPALPKWFNEEIYNGILKLINAGNRIKAIQYLYELAKEKTPGLALAECKNSVH